LIAVFGPFCFNLDTLEIRKHGVRLRLEEKPARLLACLIERRGAIVSREELRNSLWDDSVNLDFDHGLNKAVNKVRTLLGDDVSEPQHLETLSRRGYRFIGQVEFIADAETVQIRAAAEPYVEPGQGQIGRSVDHGDFSVAVAEPPPETVSSNERSTRLVLFGNRHRERRSLWTLVAISAAVLVIVAATFFARFNRTQAAVTVRAVITLPADLHLITRGEGGIAVSPDGSQVVFEAAGPDGRTRLWLRRFDSLTPEAISGTEGGSFPFWSPDGQSLGFFTDLELKRLNLSNHKVVILCTADSGRGGTWLKDGTILFARETQSPIFRISAGGGTPVPITHLDLKRYTTHRWPVILDDQKHFIFVAANHDESSRPAALFLASLDGGEPILLGEADSNVVSVHESLLFLLHGKLMAQKLDLNRSRLNPHADIVADGIEYDSGSWYGTFAASTSALVYQLRPERREQQEISWFDATGKKLGTAGQAGIFGAVSLSPDGKTIATVCGDPEFNICLMHADGTVTQVTQHGLAGSLAWAPDSSALSYTVHKGHTISTFIKQLNDAVPERAVMDGSDYAGIVSWHPDKRHALVLREAANGAREATVLDFGSGRMSSYLPAQARLLDARFSPDGRWVAYQKAWNGTDTVYISSYPKPDKTYQVTATRAVAPRWRGDGSELFFLGPDEVISAVSVTLAGDKLSISTPRQLFRAPLYPLASDYVAYDVSREGTRFLVDTSGAGDRSELVLATSWRP